MTAGRARRRPRIQGHRGALYLEPENTLAAFRSCCEMGADSVELDVFATKDGELVVFHGGVSCDVALQASWGDSEMRCTVNRCTTTPCTSTGMLMEVQKNR